MNHHLNPEEILQVADQAVANGSLTAALQHLASCPQCRNEVEFQRELRRTAERIGPAPVSKDFTSNVLRAVGVPRRRGLFTRLSDNLGSLFALMMVSASSESCPHISGPSTIPVLRTARESGVMQSTRRRDCGVRSEDISLPYRCRQKGSLLASLAVRFPRLHLPVSCCWPPIWLFGSISGSVLAKGNRSHLIHWSMLPARAQSPGFFLWWILPYLRGFWPLDTNRYYTYISTHEGRVLTILLPL